MGLSEKMLQERSSSGQAGLLWGGSVERGCQRGSSPKQKGEVPFRAIKTSSHTPTFSLLGDNSRSHVVPSLRVPGQSVWTAPFASSVSSPIATCDRKMTDGLQLAPSFSLSLG